jgi:hypothetical protein
MSEIAVLVKPVAAILNNEKLNIPDYQRPYKWERRHIRNLFYDVRETMGRGIKEYRIGSIILHRKDSETLNIVDGQQRLISISLFLYFVDKQTLPSGAKKLLNAEHIEISRLHAKENFGEWKDLCGLIEAAEVKNICNYIQNNCKVSVIEMPSEYLAEAFQLFDSQNNRGKALEPHDLLKAYHLRAIDKPTEETISKWEAYVKNSKLNLKDLFDKHLFRIRRWVNGSTGLYKKKYGSELRFSERFIDDFKGVALESGAYPYLKLYHELESHGMHFPSSLTMPIINGAAFFKFVEFSYTLFENEFYCDDGKQLYYDKLDKSASGILIGAKSRHSRNINLYINLLALFADRFGSNNVDREICEKIFVWAFYPRIEAELVYDSTIANYAATGQFKKKTIYQRIFQVLAVSSTPREFAANIDTDVLRNFTASGIVSKLTEGKK